MHLTIPGLPLRRGVGEIREPPGIPGSWCQRQAAQLVHSSGWVAGPCCAMLRMMNRTGLRTVNWAQVSCRMNFVGTKEFVLAIALCNPCQLSKFTIDVGIDWIYTIDANIEPMPEMFGNCIYWFPRNTAICAEVLPEAPRPRVDGSKDYG